MSNTKVVYDGWMVRYGRRKIGRSFLHMRYFVLESRLLAYYKRKPQDNVVPIKTLVIDGNCRVEDRGLKTQHGHMVYVLSIYNKKDKYNRITMAAFNIQEALIWKEKIESVIDQHQESLVANGNKYHSFEYKSGMDSGRNASSSDQESQYSAAEDEEDSRPSLMRRTTIGNGPPESILDWTQESSALASQNANNQAFSRKHWRLLQCQNGLRIFEELLEVDFLPKSCSRAMKAVGVVEASCEEIFELVMSMDGTRAEWDCSFQDGSLVDEVDGHTAILYHRLQLDWFPTFVWPRDLCYVRYWRRNDDGSYVVLFCSREHENCGPQPRYVGAHIESGGFNISPLKPRNGRPRSQVQHLMQIDLKGWGVGYVSSFQQHCLLQMLNSVAGLREYFAQTDERIAPPRIPVMVNMASSSVSTKKSQKIQLNSVHNRSQSLDNAAKMMDEYSDEDEDFQIPDEEAYKAEQETKRVAFEEEPVVEIDLSCFSGNLRRVDNENSRDCWRSSDGNNFKLRSKRFCYDKSKMPGGKPLMDLVAVDWFKDTKRMDHVARCSDCAAQVSNVYQTMKVETLTKTVPFFGFSDVERILVAAIKHNFIALKVDHMKGAVIFGDLGFKSDHLHGRLSDFAVNLSKSRSMINPSAKKVSKLSDMLPSLGEIVEKEHKRLLARKSIIEKRKEEQERHLVEMEREEETKRLKQQKKVEEAEKKRLATEFQEMKNKRIREEIEKREREEAEAMLKEVVGKTGKKPLLERKNMTKQQLMELAVQEQFKGKQELEKKMQKLVKTMDHLERAKREEAAPLVEAAFHKRLAEEKLLHERQQELEVELSRGRHDGDVKEKNRLQRVLEHKMQFQERVLSRRQAEYERMRAEREARLSQVLQARRDEREIKRKMLYYLRTEEERLNKLREEEEARKREEAERKKKEEAERIAKLDEIEAKKRQREQELEERERLRKEAILKGTPIDTPARPSEIPGTGTTAPVPAPAPAAPGGKYVPKFRRSEPSAQAPPPPAESDRWGTRKKDDRGDDRGAPPSDKWRPRFSR